MLKNTNTINYIHSTGSLGSQVSGSHFHIEMDLISHNSTCDLVSSSRDVATSNKTLSWEVLL